MEGGPYWRHLVRWFFFFFLGETAGDRKKFNCFLWNKHFLKQQNFLVVLRKCMILLLCVTSYPFSASDFCFLAESSTKYFTHRQNPSCLRQESLTEQSRKIKKKNQTTLKWSNSDFFSWNRACVMSLLSHSTYTAVSWLWKVLQATYHRAGGQHLCLKHGHGGFFLQNLVHHSQWRMWQSRVSHACFTSCLNLTTTSNANIKGLLRSEAWTICEG